MAKSHNSKRASKRSFFLRLRTLLAISFQFPNNFFLIFRLYKKGNFYTKIMPWKIWVSMQLYLLLYLFHQAEIFPDYKPRRPVNI